MAVKHVHTPGQAEHVEQRINKPSRVFSPASGVAMTSIQGDTDPGQLQRNGMQSHQGRCRKHSGGHRVCFTVEPPSAAVFGRRHCVMSRSKNSLRKATLWFSTSRFIYHGISPNISVNEGDGQRSAARG